MKRLLLTLLLTAWAGAGWGATYYVSEAGTETDKANATTPSSPLSTAGFNGETFTDGDTVYFMGTFNLDGSGERITLPSSGSAFGSPTQITYASYPSDPAILDGGGKDVQSDVLLTTNGVDFVVIDGFTFQDVYTAGGSGGEALSIAGSDVVVKNCVFQGWATTSMAGDGAWIEVGGDGSAPDNSQTIQDCTFSWVDGEHLSSHTAANYTLNITGSIFDSSGAAAQGTTNLFFGCTSTTNPTSLIVEDSVLISCGLSLGTPAAVSPKRFDRCRISSLDGNTYADQRLIGGVAYNFCVFEELSFQVFQNMSTETFNNCVFWRDAELENSRLFLVTTAGRTTNFNNTVFYNYDKPLWTNQTWTVNVTNSFYAVAGSWAGWTYSGSPTVVETNVTNTTAGFVDGANSDFRLDAESPAIDAGLDICSTLGGDQTDLAGVQVCDTGAVTGPWTNGVEIGAYGYVATGGGGIIGGGLIPGMFGMSGGGGGAASSPAYLAWGSDILYWGSDALHWGTE